jgi:hypothetical protein
LLLLGPSRVIEEYVESDKAEIQNWILWITEQGLWFQPERLAESGKVIHKFLDDLAV